MSKAKYATTPKVRNYVKLARELGLDVAGFEVSPDGAIRVFEARVAPTVQSLYDQYKDEL